MPTAAPEKEVIGFQVEAGTKDRLEQLRRQEGERSLSHLLRRAVLDLLDERGL